MNWNDLKVFLAIAEQGSLAGAARQLAFNHSTVFRRLNTLEQDLGVRLFERLPEGYVLTAAGERMQQLSRQADEVIQGIQRELAGQDVTTSGKVRVTTAPNIAQTIVPVALRALRDSHPGIVVEVSVGDSDYDLNRREADLALRATTRPPEHLIGKRVLSLSWWLCGSSADTGKSPRSVAQLKNTALIGADAALMRLAAFQWLESQFSSQIVARANDLSTIAALARAGVGFGLLPSDQTESGLRRLFRVPELSGELWLLTHPDLRKVQRIKEVWDALEAACHGAAT